MRTVPDSTIRRLIPEDQVGQLVGPKDSPIWGSAKDIQDWLDEFNWSGRSYGQPLRVRPKVVMVPAILNAEDQQRKALAEARKQALFEARQQKMAETNKRREQRDAAKATKDAAQIAAKLNRQTKLAEDKQLREQKQAEALELRKAAREQRKQARTEEKEKKKAERDAARLARKEQRAKEASATGEKAGKRAAKLAERAERDRQIALLYPAMSQNQIAKKLKCTQRTVSDAVMRMGIQQRRSKAGITTREGAGLLHRSRRTVTTVTPPAPSQIRGMQPDPIVIVDDIGPDPEDAPPPAPGAELEFDKEHQALLEPPKAEVIYESPSVQNFAPKPAAAPLPKTTGKKAPRPAVRQNAPKDPERLKQQVIALTEQGKGAEEIADILGIPVGQVNSYIMKNYMKRVREQK